MPLLYCFVAFFISVASAQFVNIKENNLFRKCCPRDQSLIKISEINETISADYNCVDRNDLKELYDITAEPLYLRNSIVVKHGIPIECENLQVVTLETEDELYSLNNNCYDRLVAEINNGTLSQNIPKPVALICNRTDTSVVPNINFKIQQIRKCCPRGKRFDVKHHECRSNENSSEDVWSVLLKSDQSSADNVYETNIGLPCKMDEYAVELQEDNFVLNVEGSTLYALSRDGKKERTFMPGEWCMEEEYGVKKLIAQVCTRDCDSFSAYCVRKCCPPGEHFKPRRCGTLASVCVPNEDTDVMFNISSYLNPLKKKFEGLFDVMGVRVGLVCEQQRFALNTSLPQDRHWLTKDAYLETPTMLTNQYCLEMFDRRDCPTEDVITSGVLCFIPAEDTKDFRISFIIITISSVCLALTLIVYILLPELRNLHGQTLICHVSMMLLAFTCLARVQHSVVLDGHICTMLGYGIYFGFVAAFSWLNVMCFDIWWTFGSIRTVKPLRKSGSERRRFFWYSLYAWSITIVLTMTMYVLDRYPVSVILDAEIGRNVCWFGTEQNKESDWPHYIFFVIPMGVVSCTNFILWLLTARHCAQVKSEVHRLQAGSVGDRAKKRFRIDRAKYILTGKLWVVMGAGWVSELLSTLVTQPRWLWNIVDLCNEMQGVFIFLILVVKPKLYYLIRKKLGFSPTPIDTRLEKPNAQNNATSSSGRTSSTILSRTISSDERANLRVTPIAKQQ